MFGEQVLNQPFAVVWAQESCLLCSQPRYHPCREGPSEIWLSVAELVSMLGFCWVNNYNDVWTMSCHVCLAWTVAIWQSHGGTPKSSEIIENWTMTLSISIETHGDLGIPHFGKPQVLKMAISNGWWPGPRCKPGSDRWKQRDRRHDKAGHHGPGRSPGSPDHRRYLQIIKDPTWSNRWVWNILKS
jgi:hypothetical protein